MKESKKTPKQEISIQEFIAAILSQDDVSGATLIMPGQPLVRFGKAGGKQDGNSKSRRTACQDS